MSFGLRAPHASPGRLLASCAGAAASRSEAGRARAPPAARCGRAGRAMRSGGRARRGPVLPLQVRSGAGTHPTEMSAGLTEAPVAPTDTAVGDTSIRLGATTAPAAQPGRVSERARAGGAQGGRTAQSTARSSARCALGTARPALPCPASSNTRSARGRRTGGAQADQARLHLKPGRAHAREMVVDRHRRAVDLHPFRLVEVNQVPQRRAELLNLLPAAARVSPGAGQRSRAGGRCRATGGRARARAPA